MNFEISVVIPTYNRLSYLQHCLDALMAQSISKDRFEIVLIDDGSQDGTLQWLERHEKKYGFRFYSQKNSGPSRARNVGIDAALGKLILFLGDDIVAHPDLLKQHIATHGLYPGSPLAVLGFTDWAPWIDPTPLMRHERLIAQFGYYEIHDGLVDPNNLPYGYFYTSNVSISKQFLLAHQYYFDERFKQAMGEDGELAFRMQRDNALRIVYQSQAIAYHEHPTSFDDVCRRQVLKGQVAVLQAKLHPELGDPGFINFSWKGKLKFWVKIFFVRLLMPVLRIIDKKRWPVEGWFVNKIFTFVFEYHQIKGLLAGKDLYGLRTDEKIGEMGSRIQ